MAIVKGKFTSQTNGRFPVDAETFQQLQDYIDAVGELSNMYIPANMDGAILSGCELESGLMRRGAGWLVIRGVGLVPFEGGLLADGLSVVEEDVDVVASGETYPAYVRRRGVSGRVVGAKMYSWIDIAGKANIYDIKNNIMPIGSIVLYAGESSRLDLDKWLPCDGRAVSTSAYSELFMVIGTRYNTGSVSSGTFKVPNVQNVQTQTFYIIRAK